MPTIDSLLAHPDQLAAMANRARDFLARGRGAIDRTRALDLNAFPPIAGNDIAGAGYQGTDQVTGWATVKDSDTIIPIPDRHRTGDVSAN